MRHMCDSTVTQDRVSFYMRDGAKHVYGGDGGVHPQIWHLDACHRNRISTQAKKSANNICI